MKASTVCALFLGTLFSTLDALPTNATSPENPRYQALNSIAYILESDQM